MLCLCFSDYVAIERDKGITFINLFIPIYNIILSISVTRICHYALDQISKNLISVDARDLTLKSPTGEWSIKIFINACFKCFLG